MLASSVLEQLRPPLISNFQELNSFSAPVSPPRGETLQKKKKHNWPYWFANHPVGPKDFKKTIANSVHM